MTDLSKILDKAKELEAKMKESQEKIKNIKVEGISGTNSVKVTLDGEGEMQKIEISNEILKEIFNFIAKSILTMCKMANKKELENLKNNNPKFNVNIIESWFIRYNKEGFILPHNHAGSWSCIYYVQIGKDSSKKNGSTFFLRPHLVGSSLTGDFGRKYLNADTIVINAEEGKLLVWPNYLYHGSHPYQGKENKIIISANSTINLL